MRGVANEPSSARGAGTRWSALLSTFDRGSAKFRHGKATQISNSFRCPGCWHWLGDRRHQPAGRMVCRTSETTFNPPNWVFAPTWTILYVMIAVAGWRTYLQDETTALPMQLWLAQMILNFLWSPMFFTLHSHCARPCDNPDPLGRHRKLHLGAMA